MTLMSVSSRLLCTTKWCGVVFRGYSKATRPEGPLTNCWRQSPMPTLQQKALPTTERCWTQQEADISISEALQTTLLMWVHPSSRPRGPQSSAALLLGTVFLKPAGPNCFHQTRHRTLAISSNRKKGGRGNESSTIPYKEDGRYEKNTQNLSTPTFKRQSCPSSWGRWVVEMNLSLTVMTCDRPYVSFGWLWLSLQKLSYFQARHDTTAYFKCFYSFVSYFYAIILINPFNYLPIQFYG